MNLETYRGTNTIFTVTATKISTTTSECGKGEKELTNTEAITSSTKIPLLVNDYRNLPAAIMDIPPY